MCDPILVTLLKMRPHDSQSSRENAILSSGTSPLASNNEVPPPPPHGVFYLFRHDCCCRLALSTAHRSRELYRHKASLDTRSWEKVRNVERVKKWRSLQQIRKSSGLKPGIIATRICSDAARKGHLYLQSWNSSM